MSVDKNVQSEKPVSPAFSGTIISQGADLAENYRADRLYNPGTVLMFGGDQEVTVAGADTQAVAGIVTTAPSHLMNGGLVGVNVVALALAGRVPCNVIGPVKKGDILVSAGFGFAKVNNSPAAGQVIGKSLEDFNLVAKGVIEVAVGRH
jgi:ribosomal protein S28E/S33